MLALNSNLILLIRTQESCGPVSGIFKFQSDSINTITTKMLMDVLSAFKFQSDSINTECGRSMTRHPYHFKFQSDSINTTASAKISFGFIPLNSNLILLIPRCPLHLPEGRPALNSNLILLIRRLYTNPLATLKNFKFQSDSINTVALPSYIKRRKQL